jgi:tetratricopeptide (TPR) repeat protein
LDLADHPHDPYLLMCWAMCRLKAADGAEEARQAAQRAITGFEAGSSSQLSVRLVLAAAHHRLGDRNSEFATIREAAELFPKDAIVWARLAELHEQRGEFVAAANAFRHVLDRGTLRLSLPHDPHLLTRCALRAGQILFRLGQREQALTVYEQFLRHHPDAQPVRQAYARACLAPFSINAGQGLP